MELQVDPDTGMKNYIANGNTPSSSPNYHNLIFDSQKEAVGTLPRLSYAAHSSNAYMWVGYIVHKVENRTSTKVIVSWAPQYVPPPSHHAFCVCST